MFIPLHQLPEEDGAKIADLHFRWKSPDGRQTHERVLAEMRDGANEHFLQQQFEDGSLPILTDNTDLRGIEIANQSITFPTHDNFKGTDFSYSLWEKSTFVNGLFMCNFSWAKLNECEFRDCTFICPGFAFARIQKVRFVNCDFIIGVRFSNCDFESTVFQNCHFAEPVFTDCRFDSATVVDAPRLNAMKSGPICTDPKDLTRLYAGIRSAYSSGQVFSRAREYAFRERHAATRHNIVSRRDVVSERIWEFLTGYGIRPTRVLRAMLIVFLGAGLTNATVLGIGQGMRLAAGAFFTFGVATDLLPGLPIVLQVLYVATAFLGISLTALLVTVLTNVYNRSA